MLSRMANTGAAEADTGRAEFEKRPEIRGHLGDLAWRSLSKQPSRMLLSDRGRGRRVFTRGHLLAAAAVLARRWRRTVPEPRAGVILPPGAAGFITILALALADKTPVNFNWTAGKKANEICLRQSGVKTIITSPSVREKLPDFPWPERVPDIAAEMAALPKWKIAMLRAALLARLASPWKTRLGVPREAGEREAAILFSSGSSGTPKGVVLTHRNIIANCLQIQATGLLHQDETLLACLPIFHSFGFTVTLWYPLLSGLRVAALPSPLETRRIAETIREEKATVMMGTPTFFRPYLKKTAPQMLRTLKYVVAGAEKTPLGFPEKWEARFGSQYLEGYGLTETSPVASCNLPQPGGRRRGSAGRLMPGMTARVTCPETGRTTPAEKSGVLELRGPNVFPGYFSAPEQTRKVFRDGWFVTGDLARFDAEGFLFIEGRISRFSKLGGEMVPHILLENAIARLLRLEESDAPLAAVTGKRDEAKGESLVLVAAVDLDLNEVKEKLSREGFPNQWIPKTLKRVPALPLLPSGKLNLKELNRIAAQ